MGRDELFQWDFEAISPLDLQDKFVTLDSEFPEAQTPKIGTRMSHLSCAAGEQWDPHL